MAYACLVVCGWCEGKSDDAKHNEQKWKAESWVRGDKGVALLFRREGKKGRHAKMDMEVVATAVTFGSGKTWQESRCEVDRPDPADVMMEARKVQGRGQRLQLRLLHFCTEQ